VRRAGPYQTAVRHCGDDPGACRQCVLQLFSFKELLACDIGRAFERN